MISSLHFVYPCCYIDDLFHPTEMKGDTLGITRLLWLSKIHTLRDLEEREQKERLEKQLKEQQDFHSSYLNSSSSSSSSISSNSHSSSSNSSSYQANILYHLRIPDTSVTVNQKNSNSPGDRKIVEGMIECLLELEDGLEADAFVNKEAWKGKSGGNEKHSPRYRYIIRSIFILWLWILSFIDSVLYYSIPFSI